MKTQQKANASFGREWSCRSTDTKAQEINAANPGDRGFTLVELIVTVAIVGILATLAVPIYKDTTDRAKYAGVKSDIRTMEDAIGAYALDQNKLPAQLSDLGNQGNRKDPWNNPYQYYNIDTGTGNGTRYLSWAVDPATLDNCLNHDYDLYSKGPDGQTKNLIPDPSDPAVKTTSSDDVIRVNEGATILLASEM